MDPSDVDRYLSQIETAWSMVFRAHQGSADEAEMAQHELMLRYGGAVRRYLLDITRDPDVAAELAQDFALRFLRGDFRRADPKRGRFRQYVKSALHRLVIDHHRRRRARPRDLPPGAPELAAPRETLDDLDRQFLGRWREDILEHAWKELARARDPSGVPYYTVLRFRADHPDLRSPDMAERLSAPLGRPVAAGWVRQTLSVARARYVDLVVGEVARTLPNPTEEQVEEELQNLGLWEYCRPARQRATGEPPRSHGAREGKGQG